jgi:hypothetical protein
VQLNVGREGGDEASTSQQHRELQQETEMTTDITYVALHDQVKAKKEKKKKKYVVYLLLRTC